MNWQKRATRINTEIWDGHRFNIIFWGVGNGTWHCQIQGADGTGWDAHEVDGFCWPTMREAFLEVEKEFTKMVENKVFSNRGW